jgi:hypothetical protein
MYAGDTGWDEPSAYWLWRLHTAFSRVAGRRQFMYAQRQVEFGAVISSLHCCLVECPASASPECSQVTYVSR